MLNGFLQFQSPLLKYWLWTCFAVLLLQMYLNTGTMSAYAATLDKPAVYNGYIVNYDWPQYVANYKFITGAEPSSWEYGLVLRRMLLYIIGYPFFRLFGFYAGSMLTITLLLFVTLFLFFKFIEKEFGYNATRVAMVLLCSYTGIMYWIGSPFVQNLVVPLCLWIYLLLYKMQKGNLRFQIIALIIIGILFTGYDLLPMFGPGILLFIVINKNFSFSHKFILVPIALVTFLIPQLLIKYWLTLRGYTTHNSNDEAYKIILTAYSHIFVDLPAWYIRIKNVPEFLFHCFFRSNFFVLPVLFLFCWITGRLFLKFKLNFIERCLLLSVLLLFLFNNMSPPYEGEWQMWGDWLARIYQAVFIVFLMYIVRLSEFIYNTQRVKIIFLVTLSLATIFNIIINTGGLYASPFTSYIYSKFYIHGETDSYRKNILYYGARPLGFPLHYDTEIKE